MFAAVYYYKRNFGYLIVGYEVLAEFSDSTSEAIMKGGKKEHISSSKLLDENFEKLINSRDIAVCGPDVFSRNLIRRNSDGFIIRFGEAYSCDRALIFNDDSYICDEKVYWEFSDAIEGVQ